MNKFKNCVVYSNIIRTINIRKMSKTKKNALK